MAGLTGNTIASTYNSLLKTLADGGITASLQVVEDGAGDDTCLQLSTKQFLVKSATDIDATFDVQNSSGHQLLTIDTYSNPEEVVINEGGLATVDFRVEGSSAPNALFVDGDNGRVGIGTSSPTEALHVQDANITIMTNVADDSTVNALRFKRSKHATDGSDDTVVDLDCNLGRIEFQGADGDSFETGAYITAGANETWSGSARGTFIDFYTVDNTTTGLDHRMRIDHNGKVGIGTDTPDYPLDVEGAGSQAIRVYSTDDNATLFIASHTNETYNSQLIFASGTDSRGSIVYDHHTSQGSQLMEFHVGDNAIQAMTIDGDGSVGIGTNVPGHRLHVVDAASADNSVLVRFEYNTSDNEVDAGDAILDLEFGDDNTEAGTPYYIVFSDSDSTNGSITWADDNLVAFNTSSDYRIKSNIEPIDNSLANIDKLKPSSFNIKKSKKKAYGFIAHELQEVYPNTVTFEKDAVDKDGKMLIQQVDVSKLIPFMVKAIQELSAKVTALESA